MGRILKFELYKLVHDRLFWIINFFILLINYVMCSGQNIDINILAQKLFLTIVIVSLYGTNFIAKDYEERKIIYGILSGNKKSKLLIAKALVTIVSTEIQLLIFPLCIAVTTPDIRNKEYVYFIIVYLLLGIYLTLLSVFWSTFFKSQGISIGCSIIFNILTLLSVNSSSMGLLMSHILPVGTVKLAIANMMTIQIYISILAVWVVSLLVLAIYQIKRTEF